jgi:hypothetical protein
VAILVAKFTKALLLITNTEYSLTDKILGFEPSVSRSNRDTPNMNNKIELLTKLYQKKDYKAFIWEELWEEYVVAIEINNKLLNLKSPIYFIKMK